MEKPYTFFQNFIIASGKSGVKQCALRIKMQMPPMKHLHFFGFYPG